MPSDADRNDNIDLRRPLQQCPGCTSTDLHTVIEVDHETVDFLCAACDRRWHVELGYVREVFLP